MSHSPRIRFELNRTDRNKIRMYKTSSPATIRLECLSFFSRKSDGLQLSNRPRGKKYPKRERTAPRMGVRESRHWPWNIRYWQTQKRPAAAKRNRFLGLNSSFVLVDFRRARGLIFFFGVLFIFRLSDFDKLPGKWPERILSKLIGKSPVFNGGKGLFKKTIESWVRGRLKSRALPGLTAACGFGD